MKKCGKCKQDKDESCFYKEKASSDGLAGFCKDCDKAWRKRPEVAARRRLIRTAAYASGRLRDKKLLYHFGFGLAEYEAQLVRQNGVCAICKKLSKDGRRLSVDHDHQTDKIRGLLCGSCNRALGLFGDSAEVTASATSYLLQSKTGD